MHPLGSGLLGDQKVRPALRLHGNVGIVSRTATRREEPFRFRMEALIHQGERHDPKQQAP